MEGTGTFHTVLPVQVRGENKQDLIWITADVVFRANQPTEVVDVYTDALDDEFLDFYYSPQGKPLRRMVLTDLEQLATLQGLHKA